MQKWSRALHFSPADFTSDVTCVIEKNWQYHDFDIEKIENVASVADCERHCVNRFPACVGNVIGLVYVYVVSPAWHIQGAFSRSKIQFISFLLINLLKDCSSSHWEVTVFGPLGFTYDSQWSNCFPKTKLRNGHYDETNNYHSGKCSPTG